MQNYKNKLIEKKWEKRLSIPKRKILKLIN